MESCDIMIGPGLFELGHALMEPRGRYIAIEYVNQDSRPGRLFLSVTSISNRMGDGVFLIEGFRAGTKEGLCRATYYPATGKGTIEFF